MTLQTSVYKTVAAGDAVARRLLFFLLFAPLPHFSESRQTTLFSHVLRRLVSTQETLDGFLLAAVAEAPAAPWHM